MRLYERYMKRGAPSTIKQHDMSTTGNMTKSFDYNLKSSIDFDNQKLQIITLTNNLPTNDPIKTTFGAS